MHDNILDHCIKLIFHNSFSLVFQKIRSKDFPDPFTSNSNTQHIIFWNKAGFSIIISDHSHI